MRQPAGNCGQEFYRPGTCENFLTHAKDGYYDGLPFHRVIEDFMIQGGDPKGDGTGGESIWGGKFDGGVDDSLIHVRGAVAYANSGGTDTDGSQFYIVTGGAVSMDTLIRKNKKNSIPPSAVLRGWTGSIPYSDRW